MSLLVCGVSVCVQVQNVCTVHAAARCIVFVYVFTFPLTLLCLQLSCVPVHKSAYISRKC